MLMPEPDQQVIDRRDQICRTLRSIVPADCVIDSTESMRAFDADGLSAYRQLPLAVVLPETVAQIAAYSRDGIFSGCRELACRAVLQVN